MTTQRFDPKSIDRALANIEADFEWELTFMFTDDPDREYHPGIIAYQIREISSNVGELLDEAQVLLTVNPSASIVWSAQAFEMFVKEGLCRPALLYRLAWDSEAFTEIYKIIVERNGGRTLSTLLTPLAGLDLNRLRSESGIDVWQGILDRNSGVIALRNNIVHRGDKATLEEAKSSLTLVKDFIRLTQSFFDEAVKRIAVSMKRNEL